MPLLSNSGEDKINQNLREAFLKIKQDMSELRELQDSSIKALSKRIDEKVSGQARQYNMLSARLEETMNNFMDKSDSQVEELRNEISSLSSRVENSISEFNEQLESHDSQINESVERAKERLEAYSDRLADMNAKQKKFERSLDLMSAKLQEFDNMSVDIEDVEKSFVTREEVKERLSEVKGSAKELKKAVRELDRLTRQINDIEERQHLYANESDVKRNMEEVLDLKSRLALREDLEQMNERIDRFSDRLGSGSKELKGALKKVDASVADVLSLKKDFVTKEQFTDLRKEIKLLVQGLKEIQKLKKMVK